MYNHLVFAEDKANIHVFNGFHIHQKPIDLIKLIHRMTWLRVVNMMKTLTNGLATLPEPNISELFIVAIDKVL